MGWSIGFDRDWRRDIGYGVPAICDHPECDEQIDRGLACVCAGQMPKGGDGCGLYFCEKHHCGYIGDIDGEDTDEVIHGVCERCSNGEEPFEPKPDVPLWTTFKLTDESWAEWRKEEGIPEPTEELKVAYSALEHAWLWEDQRTREGSVA